MTKNKTLIDFLEGLDTLMAQSMLKDLQDDDRRCPQLYNSIGKLLERHKFQISKLQPDQDILGSLSGALTDYQEMLDSSSLDDSDYLQ
jgi:hypothetical protein